MTSLRQGANGPEVADLQRQLNQQLPPNQRIPVDGDFGPRTEAAVRNFQRSRGLEPDGVAGPKVQNQLAQPARPPSPPRPKPEPPASSSAPPPKTAEPPGPKADPPAKKAEPPGQKGPLDGGKGGVAPRLITTDQLRAIVTTVRAPRAEALIDPLNRAMAEFEIVTRLRIAAFLAQLAHESGGFRWMEELASGNAYDLSVNPRKARQLGNTQPGDGPRYKGRGPLQLTGRDNYRTAGRALGVDLEQNPTIASSPEIGFRIAGWYWKNRRLNTFADAGDFWNLTYRINTARLHYEDRKKYYDKALRILPEQRS
jgi:putative chitinase